VPQAQHYEVNWILGRYPLMAFGLQPDPLSVVERQMHEAAALCANPGPGPKALSPCNVAWDNLYARAGAAAYLASSAAAPPALRSSLLELLDLWRASEFCQRRAAFRYQYGTLRAPLPRDDESQWVTEHAGTCFIVKLVTWLGGGQVGVPIDMIVTVLSYQSGQSFAELPDFKPVVTRLGAEARLQEPTALAELLARMKRQGPPAVTLEIGEELARRTGLSVPAAILIWAGCTEANNAGRVVVTPEVRKALGLQVKQVDAAAAALRQLHALRSNSALAWWYNTSGETMPRQAFYDLYQEAMPDDPNAL
jgi:hypothetical protein